MRTEFLLGRGTTRQLAGWRTGSGPPVLVLHGGPGLSFDYLDAMIADIGEGYEVATYQQRGLDPSTTSCPIDIAQEVDDVSRVLDHLGWPRAWIVGHSWGGHLLLHFAVARRLRLFGGLAVDPLGGVGDGGLAAFGAEMRNRATEENLAQAGELEQAMEGGEPTDEGMRRHLALMWPGYFAHPAAAPPMPPIRVSAAAYATLLASVEAELPRLDASLGAIDVPMGFLAGSRSPIPPEEAARATAARIPGAWVEVADGAGHFPWHECPGSVRRSLSRLIGGGTADR
jgi:pimeloyl-ACP methyl ester carboxylesterase